MRPEQASCTATFSAGTFGTGIVHVCGNAATRILLPRPEGFAVGNGQSSADALAIARWIEAYFQEDVSLEGLPIRLPGDIGDFTRRVLELCAAIPRGEVRYYGELAKALGQPGASRAVGQVMATNPLPLVIPCHRVVPASGGIGSFNGGVALKPMKQWLLDRESAGMSPFLL